MEKPKTVAVTDVEKVIKWLKDIYQKGREDIYQNKNNRKEEQFVFAAKFPVKLISVDKELFKQVFDELIGPRYSDKYTKMIDNVLVHFITQTFVKDKLFNHKALKEDLTKVGFPYYVTQDFEFWKVSIHFHSKDVAVFKKLFNKTAPKKETKEKELEVSDLAVVTDDLIAQVAKYSKNQSQAKACEKFNLPIKKVKEMCSEYRKQNASK